MLIVRAQSRVLEIGYRRACLGIAALSSRRNIASQCRYLSRIRYPYAMFRFIALETTFGRRSKHRERCLARDPNLWSIYIIRAIRTDTTYLYVFHVLLTWAAYLVGGGRLRESMHWRVVFSEKVQVVSVPKLEPVGEWPKRSET